MNKNKLIQIFLKISFVHWWTIVNDQKNQIFEEFSLKKGFFQHKNDTDIEFLKRKSWQKLARTLNLCNESLNDNN